eukprot:4020635-Prymnesium_polylepis.1
MENCLPYLLCADRDIPVGDFQHRKTAPTCRVPNPGSTKCIPGVSGGGGSPGGTRGGGGSPGGTRGGDGDGGSPGGTRGGDGGDGGDGGIGDGGNIGEDGGTTPQFTTACATAASPV